MNRRGRYPQEVRDRAVRLVQEHRGEYPSEWAAISSIAGKLGVGTEALRLWLRRGENGPDPRPGGPPPGGERHREPERGDRGSGERRGGEGRSAPGVRGHLKKK